MARTESKDIGRPPAIRLTINGEAVSAYPGETIATVVLAHKQLMFNKTGGGKARGPYCNMGTCFECQVRVARRQNEAYRWLRACMVLASDGMSIITGESRQSLGGPMHED